MVGKQLGAHAQLVALLIAFDAAMGSGKAGYQAFARSTRLAVCGKTVRLIIGATGGHVHLHLPVVLKVHHRTLLRFRAPSFRGPVAMLHSSKAAGVV
jgi:hypothetical protein